MKKIAILQSNYIPWKGYFDLINSVDEFIIYDDVQYTKNDWRNRNKIKTADGTRWLTIPVLTKGLYKQSIREVQTAKTNWTDKHYKTLSHEYARSPYFQTFKKWLKSLYDKVEQLDYLSEVNELFINEVCKVLEITTTIKQSSEFKLKEERSEKLLSICLDSKADVYVSGPAAKNYLNVDSFNSVGVRVEWFCYDNYPEYKQLNPPFEHSVSILDLIFNTGYEATGYMNSFNKKSTIHS